MTKKSRYLILAACIVFFMLAAPAILLYVRGMAYDKITGSFYKTGILAVKSEPKDIQIKLDGELYRKGAGTLRFIKPKEYVVSLEKNGFQTWSKRLPVESAKVTWANPAGQNIILFFDKPQMQIVSEDASRFLMRAGRIFFTTPKELFATTLAKPEEKTAYPLKAPVQQITAIPGGDLLALKTQSTSTPWQIFDAGQNVFTATGQGLDKDAEIKFQDSGKLYILEENKLIGVSLANNKKTALLENIENILYEGGYFYYLRIENNSLSFYTSASLEQPGILLAQKLPVAKNTRIILNSQKQAFVLLDQTLYRIADQPVLLAENVKNLELSPNKDTLALTTSSELLAVYPGSSKTELVSRSLHQTTHGLILPAFGYGFLAKENKVIAEELDLRDRQNEFILYSGEGPLDFSLSEDAKQLVVLDNLKLKILTIR